jgi:hypothetical protein
MAYGVIWLQDAPETGKRKLISAPESLEAKTAEEAKKEGMQILTELSPENKEVMKPLSIVEVDDRILYGISGCERIYLTNAEDDGELEFVDISQTDYWSTQGWWHR